MPSQAVNYSEASRVLANEEVQQPLVFKTSKGNALLEIQGELIVPTEKPEGLNEDEEARYIKVDGENDAVKIGTLDIESEKATLFIGTSQRLIGTVKKLEPPLGLLKLDKSADGEGIRLVDVVKYKIIFTGRPLPIM